MRAAAMNTTLLRRLLPWIFGSLGAIAAAGCASLPGVSVPPAVMDEPVVVPTYDRQIRNWERRYAGRDYPRHSLAEPAAIAENLLAFQNADGGWPKDLDYLRILFPHEREALRRVGAGPSTLDNDATTTHLAYLAALYQRTGDTRYRRAAERGLDWIFLTQRESGGWRGADVDAITFNDDLMAHVMHLLHDIEQSADYLAWLDGTRRGRASAALTRALACVLRSQVEIEGRLTAWGQQHSHETFEPVEARSYELPGLTANESVGVVRYLMRLEDPGDAIIASIEAAVHWLHDARLEGIRIDWVPIEPVRFRWHTARSQPVVIEDPQADPVWARYYEIDTGRPFFADRDGVKVYALEEVGLERQTGYAWYGTWPASLLEHDYPAWRDRHGRPCVISGR
ncbi:MAG: pectate lyase [Puniceicoccaceae bacterium]|nr:MAG: pectate lyase [Puniceicoccaceae bacterium]